MDHHVVEDAAGDLHIVDGGGLGVTGADLHQVDLADLARPDGLIDGPVVVVKTAVEAHLELDPGLFRLSDDLLHPLDAVVHRLLHEHVLSCLCHFDGVLGVEVGRGADDDGLDFRVIQNEVHVIDDVGDAQALQELHRLLAHEGVGNDLDLHLGDKLGDVLRVYLADASGANDTDFNSLHSVHPFQIH